MIRLARRRRAWLSATLAVATLAVAGAAPAAARTAAPPVVDDSDCMGAQPIICVTFATGPTQAAIAPVTISPGPSCADEDVHRAQYRLRDSNGRVSGYEPDRLDGSSVRAVIADCAPSGVLGKTTFVTVGGPYVRSHYLSVLDASRAALSATSYENGLSPVVYFDGSNAGYVRPLRNDDGDDVNASDTFLDNQFVHVVVHTAGHILHPTIANPGTSHPAAGRPVTLTANVPDAYEGTLTYRWFFADGQTADTTTPSVTHSYTKVAASYRPSVTVTATDTSYGQSAPLAEPIVIGKPPPKSSGTPGPGGKGGVRNPENGPVDGRGNRAGGAPTSTDAAGPSGSGTGDVDRGRPGAQSSGSGASRSAARPQAGGPEGFAVSGLLLDPALGGGRPSASAGAAAAPSARRAGEAGLDLTFLWLLVPLVLLGAGVATERRRPVPAGKARHQ